MQRRAGGLDSNADASNERSQIIGGYATTSGDPNAVLWTLRRG